MRRSVSRVVADAILADFVHGGTLKPGDRLPTVRELERLYDASRATIVHALSMLEQQGRCAEGTAHARLAEHLPDRFR